MDLRWARGGDAPSRSPGEFRDLPRHRERHLRLVREVHLGGRLLGRERRHDRLDRLLDRNRLLRLLHHRARVHLLERDTRGWGRARDRASTATRALTV
ncbi:MAG: hypothetical protein KDA21_09400, partial [Phycisphaerales bacterium]|nr:hypothetical protein [Phycisphaerales bacterium]